MNSLVLGYGQLGKEIVKQTGWNYISRKKDKFDICDMNTYFELFNNYNLVINCVANTNTYSLNKEAMLEVNFKAVVKLSSWCNSFGVKLVQISSDYIYADSVSNASEKDVPVHARNWYSYSKLLADGYVQTMSDNYLLIRTSFKPYPFPYEKAITTQKGNFDYTNNIASLIIKLIEKDAKGIFNVGTEIKTIYDLAIRTVPDVEKSWSILHPSMPTNITMNVNKMKEFLNED
jgi:dTDP-4-dehydrorhamnose reductase